jgi:hypothetical protein
VGVVPLATAAISCSADHKTWESFEPQNGLTLRFIPITNTAGLSLTFHLYSDSICFNGQLHLIPDCAVETSWGRMWGWNRREKRDRGNDIVGMSCRLIRYGPFQLRRNWKSL